jgi:pimeloyl-ACP methyl ester carboxylesterase
VKSAEGNSGEGHVPFIPIRYARTHDGFDIAWWKLGHGPLLLHSGNVQLGHVREEWSVPAMRRWYGTLARSFTVVRYDHRGGGLSSRGGPDGCTRSIEALVADIEAVAGDVASGPFVLLGLLTGGVPAIAYAAAHPAHVSHLVLLDAFARDVAHGQAPRLRALFDMAATDWELFTESISQAALGWTHADEARRWAEVARAATTQAEFLAFVDERRTWDVSAALPRVRAPTLVLHDATNALASEERSRELAGSIPDASFLTCNSENGAPGGQALVAIRSFVGQDEARAVPETHSAVERAARSEGSDLANHLRARLDREAHLPVADVLRIVREVADALSYAHGLGVIHRDIKPGNIFLSAGHALVSDFGIARALDVSGGNRLTETGVAIGTPAYMSPEQGLGASAVDERSDLYALACVAYEMLAGTPPFTGPTPHSIIVRHSLDPVPPIRTLRPTVPQGVEAAIHRALAKIPADRYATTLEFAEALDRGAADPTTPRS